jgi:RNA polymerase sigma factor (TIGR02999 family)
MSLLTGEVTALLVRWSDGEAPALDELLPLVYQDLHRRAGRLMRGEREGHTLQATALLHETYFELRKLEGVPWQNRSHFFAAAVKMMRRVLVNHARTRAAAKRRAAATQLAVLGEDEAAGEINPAASQLSVEELAALSEAIDQLEKLDERQSKTFELRHWGFTSPETAEILDISVSTVEREYRLAKAFVYRALSEKTHISS